MVAERKKNYQKPVVQRVAMIPHENVLTICHQGSLTGPYPDDPCYGFIGTCQDALLKVLPPMP